MVGQYVTSKSGHDKGTLYLVVAEDEKNLYLADGRTKTTASPKKKSRKHVQPINSFASATVVEKLRDGATFYPEEIRYAIKQYMEQQNAEASK